MKRYTGIDKYPLSQCVNFYFEKLEQGSVCFPISFLDYKLLEVDFSNQLNNVVFVNKISEISISNRKYLNNEKEIDTIRHKITSIKEDMISSKDLFYPEITILSEGNDYFRKQNDIYQFTCSYLDFPLEKKVRIIEKQVAVSINRNSQLLINIVFCKESNSNIQKLEKVYQFLKKILSDNFS